MRELLCVVIAAAATTGAPGAVLAENGKPGQDVKAPAPEFHRVETPRYSVEVPKGWDVGEETPFGQREITPGESPGGHGGSMSTMTGPGLGRQSWSELYRTANFYIQRYSPGGEKMTATPYRVGKTNHGYASCSWDMTDADGIPVQHHVILKRTSSDILALSVKIPAGTSRERRSQLGDMFRHLVDSAVMR